MDILANEFFSYLCSPKQLNDSYTRCRLAGVPVELLKPRNILPENKLINCLAVNTKLLNITDHLFTRILSSKSPIEYLLILCDQELVALKLYATKNFLGMVDNVEIDTGTIFTEESCGTNALSLAREYERIVAIKSDQHYSKLFKNWWCVAGPLKDYTGKTTGYLDISMLATQELCFVVEFLKAIIFAAEKETFLLDLVSKELQPEQQSSLSAEAERKLTPREIEIYKLLLQRLSSTEIAAALQLSISTVRTYRKNIYQKLGVNKLADLLSKYSR
jgi:transcriptional regulator of acetoin/glycerol metabolism